MMNIGIDIDDTIVSTTEHIIKYADKYSKEVLGKENMNTNMGNIHTRFYLRDIYGWNNEIKDDFFEKYYKNIMSECDFLPYAKEYLIKLKEEGHNLIYITARTTEVKCCDTCNITENMFLENGIPYDKIIYDSWNKTDKAQENNIDIMIEDCYDTCVDFNNLGIKSILMTSDINSNIIEDENIIRVNNWKEVYSIITEEICERKD